MYCDLDAGELLKIIMRVYLQRIIAFVCTQNENVLIFSIDSIFICDFLLIEIYEVLGVRRKGICDGKKRCGFDNIWS